MTGNRYQQRGKNVELDLLRIVMIQRALTCRDLAVLAGKNPQRIANVLSSWDRTWPIRAAINRALKRKIFRKPVRRKVGRKATNKEV